MKRRGLPSEGPTRVTPCESWAGLPHASEALAASTMRTRRLRSWVQSGSPRLPAGRLRPDCGPRRGGRVEPVRPFLCPSARCRHGPRRQLWVPRPPARPSPAARPPGASPSLSGWAQRPRIPREPGLLRLSPPLLPLAPWPAAPLALGVAPAALLMPRALRRPGPPSPGFLCCFLPGTECASLPASPCLSPRLSPPLPPHLCCPHT